MASVGGMASGKSGGRRTLDYDINMVPMIDLMMVTIAFLLITAVWVDMHRLEADAKVPGTAETPPCEGAACKPEKKLHVYAVDRSKFTLAWKEGPTLIGSIDIPFERTVRGSGSVAFAGLSDAIAKEWKDSGLHREPTDRKFDRAVVHASNEMSYAEVVAIMDAISEPKRPTSLGAAKTDRASAFAMTFAAD